MRVGYIYIYIYIFMSFLISSLVGCKWLALHPDLFSLGDRTHGDHWTGGWAGPRASQDDGKRRKILPNP
jgi:hypothetical protein